MEALIPKELSEELNRIQLDFYTAGIPVLVVFEGSSGRVINRVINEIIRCLEPRGISYDHFDPKTAGPRLIFDYLEGTPVKGAFSLYDRSWYSMVIDRYTGDKANFETMIGSCNKFERYLTDNGTFIIKVLLNATPEDVERYGDDYCPALCMNNTFLSVDKIDPVKFRTTMVGGLLKATDTEYAPWNVIEVSEVRKTTLKAAQVIKECLNKRYLNGARSSKVKLEEKYPNPRKGLELNVKYSDDKELEEYSDKLYELQSILAASNRSLVIGLEGWDAAGKGSVIKHLTYALNPKGYVVRQVKAPTEEELAHTYLWRFSHSMPDAGHVTIFDRTWYGRMIVEPIERLCSKEEYERSASEINDMEAMMVRNGTIMIKFWLDISSEEQLERFNKRAQCPLKQWKLTDDDWRNREKWDQYDEYVSRAISSTNTQYAPWTVIPANNKKYARVLVIRTVVDRLRTELVEKRFSNIL
jgi:AMP-polyphosphate phosphotransferase